MNGLSVFFYKNEFKYSGSQDKYVTDEVLHSSEKLKVVFLFLSVKNLPSWCKYCSVWRSLMLMFFYFWLPLSVIVIIIITVVKLLSTYLIVSLILFSIINLGSFKRTNQVAIQSSLVAAMFLGPNWMRVNSRSKGIIKCWGDKKEK